MPAFARPVAAATVRPNPNLALMTPFVPFRRAARRAQGSSAAALVARAAAGDEVALAELYRGEAGPVYRYALALCGNPDWAADATQEAFVALVAGAQGYDPARGSLGAWLAGIARHALAATWRRARTEEPLAVDGEDERDDDDGPAWVEGHEATPETLLVRAQTGAEVWAALRRLPAAQREAVVLVDLQDRPYAEAARIVGIELNTLRTRLHRARLRLAALLDAGPEPSP